MTFPPIIAARRDGSGHTLEELRFLADGAAKGTIPDYQLAAWLMAAYLNPLSEEETAWLTQAMAESGERIDLTGLPKPWVDKHSTGGVGDKTSIVLLPLLAACGLTVIKMSGRGLGITGGTVDKLSSLPGFKLDMSPEEMKTQAAKIGLAMTGQSPDLAPADKALCALRDVTETVGSIPLIVSSILSKKLAGGAEVVVLDVKCGSGAFMKSRKEAELLATALSRTAGLCGLKTRIVISDMAQPLGAAIGNALEVEEALRVLSPIRLVAGTPSARFRDLCVELAAITLQAAGLCPNIDSATELSQDALRTGKAQRKAAEWFVAQGSVDPFAPGFTFDAAPFKFTAHADVDGSISKIDAETVGQAVVALGGGRIKKDDKIDHRVGVVLHECVGAQVRAGTPIFDVHAATEEAGRSAIERVKRAYEFSSSPPEFSKTVLKVV